MKRKNVNNSKKKKMAGADAWMVGLVGVTER